MKLAVHSLKKTLYDGDAVSMNAKSAAGEITVLDHHRPLITELAEGVITIIDKSDKMHYIPISSGFLEVNSENQAWLLVDEE